MAKRYPIPITELREVVIGWEQRCDVCDESFESKRKDALYCSAKCRQVASRAETKKKPRAKKRAA